MERLNTERIRISPYDNWIAARFDEPKRAGQVLGDGSWGRLNHYSGKWNFVFGDESIATGDAMECFVMELRPLLCKEGNTAT